MANRRSIERKKRLLLEALRRGSFVTEAVAYAGIRSRQTVYDWREADAEFAEAWDIAFGGAMGELRHVAFDKAKSGDRRLLVWFMELAERRARGQSSNDEEVQVAAEIDIQGLEPGEEYTGEFISFVETKG